MEHVLERMLPYMDDCLWINVDRLGAGERSAIEIARFGAQWGVSVMTFASQSKSTNPTLFKDLKAQMYFYMRDMMFMGNLKGLTDRTTKQQLLAVRYEYGNNGAFQIESKKNMKKRGVDSPDRAEALIYAAFDLSSFEPFRLAIGS